MRGVRLFFGIEIRHVEVVIGVLKYTNKILCFLWLKNIPYRLTINADMSRICVPFKEGEAVRCLTKT